MQLEQTFGCPWIIDLSVIGLNYGFQNSARAALRASLLRNVGVEVAKFGGTAYDKAPASAFDAMVSAFRRS
jgi:hypothetical protein